MINRNVLAILLAANIVSSVYADTVIVDDDFESYVNDAALEAVWEPRIGSGTVPPLFPGDGILTTDDVLFPGIQGQGVDHLGGSVMQHSAITPTSPVLATESESIHLAGDIFIGADAGNSRMSIGLRNRSVQNDANVGNLLEMGIYNATGIDPTDGVTEVPVTNFAYRLVLFDERGEDLVQQPNWLYFEFDTALDIDDTDPATEEPTPDGLVSLVDIGPGWHRYSATITPDTVTMEMDLFRDGLDNGATLTAGSDVTGIDASVTYNLSSSTNGFDSFRIGSPSGISSATGVAFDNVALSLVDVTTGGGSDADNDGDIDGDDFLALQRDNPSGIAQWQSDYPLAPSLSASAVPEPASMTILIAAGMTMLAARRR